MHKRLFFLGCFFAGTAVILGAFGAHSLEASLSTDQLDTYEMGIRYHFYHSLALLLAALTAAKVGKSKVEWAGWLFTLGILLFSGSIYLLACRELLEITHWTWLGPLTPIGGLCFIMGWGILAWSAFNIKGSEIEP